MKEFSAEYDLRKPRFEQLRTEVLFALEECLRSLDVKIHSVSSRVKTLESLKRKAELKQVSSPLDEIRDIVGVRVVCLFLSDIPRVADAIRDAFLVTREDDRIEGAADAASFGYMSLHLDVAMKHTHSGPRYDAIVGIPFEIQLRTIAMDAWANVSHHLSYHRHADVPDELRRDFYALSGLFYVADKHFEIFYRAREIARRHADETLAKGSPQEIREQTLNIDILAAYLVGKFRNRTHSDSTAISDLLEELLHVGVTTIGHLDEIIERTKRGFAALEKDDSVKYHDVGAVRGALYLFDQNYLRRSEELEDGGFLPKRFAERDARFKNYRRLVRNRRSKPAAG